jgi:hypothetical protein
VLGDARAASPASFAVLRIAAVDEERFTPRRATLDRQTTGKSPANRIPHRKNGFRGERMCPLICRSVAGPAHAFRTQRARSLGQ